MASGQTKEADEETLLADSDRLLSHDSRATGRKHRKLGQAKSSFGFAWSILLRLLAMCGLFAILTLAYSEISVRIKRNPGDCDCGKSIIEARRRGCEWDSMAGAWLPEHCRDPELTEQFKRSSPAGAWIYYADESKGVVLNETQVSRLAEADKHTYWVTLDWHVAHCLFYWKKTRRSEWTGTVIEERYSNIDHIVHCEELIWRWRGLDGGQVVAQEAVLSSEWHP
jgi:hypothetical protein